MGEKPFSILVLCTGNSARSILGEAILAELGDGRLVAYSAGSKPKGVPHPGALRCLLRKGINPPHFRSKSWDEFSGPGAPAMDFVFTVCDDAAGETCPIWPGHPMTAHWGIEDPSHVQGPTIERERAFVTALRYLENRIKLFIALPFDRLDALALRAHVREIGQVEGASTRRGDAA